jgi:hypothetical protein
MDIDQEHEEEYDEDEWDDDWDDEDLETACGNCLAPTCGDECDECGVPLCHMCAECVANFCEKCPTERFRYPWEDEVKEERSLCEKLKAICGGWLCEVKWTLWRSPRMDSSPNEDLPF